VIIFQLKV